MFCSKCGAEIEENAKFCAACGQPVNQVAEEPVQQNGPEPAQQFNYQQAPPEYQPVYQAPVTGTKNKIAAGLLGIFLGSLGIHKFYLGYTKSGIIMLLVSLLTFGFGAFVMEIIGLIEGIIYITKSDEEFYNTYEANEKQWF